MLYDDIFMLVKSYMSNVDCYNCKNNHDEKVCVYCGNDNAQKLLYYADDTYTHRITRDILRIIEEDDKNTV